MLLAYVFSSEGGGGPNIQNFPTGSPEKKEPQFLLNFSRYKHARKRGHNSLERWDP